MGNNLEHYLNLDYDVVISRRESDGLVSYKAYARELDPFEFYGVGDTKQEALESFEETKKELFELYLEEGRPIPEPTREDDILPSGKFVLRIDPAIHYRLIDLAKSSQKSLNSYIDQVLVAHVSRVDVTESLKELIIKYIQIRHTSYNVDDMQAYATKSEVNISGAYYEASLENTVFGNKKVA